MLKVQIGVVLVFYLSHAKVVVRRLVVRFWLRDLTAFRCSQPTTSFSANGSSLLGRLGTLSFGSAVSARSCRGSCSVTIPSAAKSPHRDVLPQMPAPHYAK